MNTLLLILKIGTIFFKFIFQVLFEMLMADTRSVEPDPHKGDLPISIEALMRTFCITMATRSNV